MIEPTTLADLREQIRRIERLSHGEDDIGCPRVPEAAEATARQILRRLEQNEQARARPKPQS